MRPGDDVRFRGPFRRPVGRERRENLRLRRRERGVVSVQGAPSMSNTTELRCRRAASSTLSVPCTLTSQSRYGSVTEAVTLRLRSEVEDAGRTSSADHGVDRVHVRDAHRLELSFGRHEIGHLPLERSSMTTTESPAARQRVGEVRADESRSARNNPMFSLATAVGRPPGFAVRRLQPSAASARSYLAAWAAFVHAATAGLLLMLDVSGHRCPSETPKTSSTSASARSCGRSLARSSSWTECRPTQPSTPSPVTR